MQLFAIIYTFSKNRLSLRLKDNPLNRFIAEECFAKLKIKPRVEWVRESFVLRFINVLLYYPIILFFSLRTGLKIGTKRRKYKVMREALWGLQEPGLYLHDDFLVDGNKIRKEDLLLFSRNSIKECSTRMKASEDAKKSVYAYFYLPSLKLDVKSLLSRTILLYIIKGLYALLKEIKAANFTIFISTYRYFYCCALPYEKIFSNFEILAELGHNYFSANSIAESIVCQNFKAQYCLMHWSDISMTINKSTLSFLGCDDFFIWGDIHACGLGGDQIRLKKVGYVFKNFIKEAGNNRHEVLSVMGIRNGKKIISFFDETFGNDIYCEMTEEHYVNFWNCALDFAKKYNENLVVMKPKELERYQKLSYSYKKRFIEIKQEMEMLDNVYIADCKKWTFIEIIGISDVVISQGMTSSSTIAIICGKDGIYFDEYGYNHLLARLFKDKIVFDEPEKLFLTINAILSNKLSVKDIIPENILRDFDAYNDDLGLERMRLVLTGKLIS